MRHLGDLLKEKRKTIELIAAGGVISVMQFGNRQMTRDIDGHRTLAAAGRIRDDHGALRALTDVPATSSAIGVL